jgi:hypothetical protein
MTKRIEKIATKAGTLYVKPENVDFNMKISIHGFLDKLITNCYKR